MAKTIRKAPKVNDPRRHSPTSKARKTQRRRERQSSRIDVRNYR